MLNKYLKKNIKFELKLLNFTEPAFDTLPSPIITVFIFLFDDSCMETIKLSIPPMASDHYDAGIYTSKASYLKVFFYVIIYCICPFT